MNESWYEVVAPETTLTQGDLIFDCALLMWSTEGSPGFNGATGPSLLSSCFGKEIAEKTNSGYSPRFLRSVHQALLLQLPHCLLDILGGTVMAITVEAVYEDGVLKLDRPLPLNNLDRVQVTVQVKQSVARESAGMLRWDGDWETLRRLAEDDEFGIMESP